MSAQLKADTGTKIAWAVVGAIRASLDSVRTVLQPNVLRQEGKRMGPLVSMRGKPRFRTY